MRKRFTRKPQEDEPATGGKNDITVSFALDPHVTSRPLEPEMRTHRAICVSSRCRSLQGSSFVWSRGRVQQSRYRSTLLTSQVPRRLYASCSIWPRSLVAIWYMTSGAGTGAL